MNRMIRLRREFEMRQGMPIDGRTEKRSSWGILERSGNRIFKKISGDGNNALKNDNGSRQRYRHYHAISINAAQQHNNGKENSTDNNGANKTAWLHS